MSYARPLLDTYPRTVNVDAGVLAGTIDAVNDRAQACTADADDDLSEQNLTEMVKCIRLCLDCADVCTATVRVTSRQTDYDANVSKPLLKGLRGRVQELWRRVRAAFPDSRALPHLRRGLPALRGSLPGAPGRHEITGQPFRPVQFKRSRPSGAVPWLTVVSRHGRDDSISRSCKAASPGSDPRPPPTDGGVPAFEINSPARSTLLRHRCRTSPTFRAASPGADDGLGPGGPGVQIGTRPTCTLPLSVPVRADGIAPMSRLTTVPSGRVPQ